MSFTEIRRELSIMKIICHGHGKGLGFHSLVHFELRRLRQSLAPYRNSVKSSSASPPTTDPPMQAALPSRSLLICSKQIAAAKV